MKIALLYNRHSRRGSKAEVEAQVLGTLQNAGLTVELLVPQKQGDMTRLAAEATRGPFDMLVAAGGDGTLNEVVNGCIGQPMPVGHLPLGTVNVWARCLGIPLDLDGAVQNLVKGQPREVSVGRVNGRAFMFCAGIGLDSEVLFRGDGGWKKYIGPYAYYWQTIKTLATFQPPLLALSLDGEDPIPCRAVVVGKAPLYGDRFYLTPKADPFDDMLDVCYFRELSAGRFMASMLRASRAGSHLGSEYIGYRKVRQLKLTSEQQAHIQVDGEYLGTLPGELSVVPRAIRAVLPLKG
jgi:diacylglycerol kinase (ATP)